MLSDRERETLREIQRQLATDDPDLAQKLDRVEPPSPPGPGRGAWLGATIGCLFFMFVLLASQSPFGTLLFLVAAAVCGVMYLRADRHLRANQQAGRRP
ncbi:DUF3040 domain-containing protein [Nakamurella lactea]|uniref:DUF3040 domain-containing protein n=1 Tax=Nakamurella lactea TaxID=459515 RepID=UPI000428304E|nr:DUF3040 domain-containing protein [Nakamurella lactea]